MLAHDRHCHQDQPARLWTTLFVFIEIMDLWMLLTTVVRIYSYLVNFLIMKKVGESLTTKFARYFCWQKLGH